MTNGNIHAKERNGLENQKTWLHIKILEHPTMKAVTPSSRLQVISNLAIMKPTYQKQEHLPPGLW